MKKFAKLSMLFVMLAFLCVALVGCAVDLEKKEEQLKEEDYIVLKYDDEDELKSYQDKEDEYVVVGVLVATKITESGIIINLENASQARKYLAEIEEEEDYEFIARKGSSIVAATTEELFKLLK